MKILLRGAQIRIRFKSVKRIITPHKFRQKRVSIYKNIKPNLFYDETSNKEKNTYSLNEMKKEDLTENSAYMSYVL